MVRIIGYSPSTFANLKIKIQYIVSLNKKV